MNVLAHGVPGIADEALEGVFRESGTALRLYRTSSREEFEAFLRSGREGCGPRDVDLIIADHGSVQTQGEHESTSDDPFALARGLGFEGGFVLTADSDPGAERAVDLARKGVDDLVFTDNLSRLARTIGRLSKGLRRERDDALIGSLKTGSPKIEDQYKSLFMNAVEGVFQIGLDGRFLRVNPAMVSILGFADQREVLALGPEDVAGLFRADGVYESFLGQLQSRGSVIGFEAEIQRPDASLAWISMNARVAGFGGAPRVDGFAVDVTQRRLTETRLKQLAYMDGLTGLPNRVHFMDRLGHALARARRDSTLSLAVVYFDLDRFKFVNDTLGHPMGDQLLMEFGVRLSRALRQSDTPARMGGDEFALILENPGGLAGVAQVVERVRAEVAQPFWLAEQEVYVGASIGVVLDAEQYATAEAAIRDADVAMYRAKAARGQSNAPFVVFEERMKLGTDAAVRLDRELREALKKGEFELHYQPVVTPRDGKPFKFEALLRWNHPVKGLLRPAEFLHAAEESGIVAEIDKWAISAACGTLSRWGRRFGVFAPNVSVNVSARQALDESFPNFVSDCLALRGLQPWNLEIEISEMRALEHAERMTEALRALKAVGLRVAIDDFGAGHACPSYLRSLPVDIIKIDRQFVRAVGRNSGGQDIVAIILSLAQKMRVETVAEGVETGEQMEHIASLGCHFAQGFYFARPLAQEAAEAYLGRFVR